MKDSVILSIIIVTWNSQSDIRSCIDSVLRSAKQISSEVIVVDNKSSDKTTSIIEKNFPKITLLKLKKNVGFGQGNNIGLKIAKGKYILLLNPDTIINTHAIQTMLNYLEKNPRAGVVGPEQYNDKHTTIFMASRVSFFGICEYVIEKIYTLITNTSKVLFPWPHKTFMLNGGCVFARNSILPTREWFDPDCFIYGEEQYLFKQVAEQKWGVYFLRNCSIIHLREKSIMQTKNKHKFVLDSATVLIKKSPLGRLFFR